MSWVIGLAIIGVFFSTIYYGPYGPDGSQTKNKKKQAFYDNIAHRKQCFDAYSKAIASYYALKTTYREKENSEKTNTLKLELLGDGPPKPSIFDDVLEQGIQKTRCAESNFLLALNNDLNACLQFNSPSNSAIKQPANSMSSASEEC